MSCWQWRWARSWDIWHLVAGARAGVRLRVWHVIDDSERQTGIVVMQKLLVVDGMMYTTMTWPFPTCPYILNFPQCLPWRSNMTLYAHLPCILLLFPHLLALHEACKQECRLQCLPKRSVSLCSAIRNLVPVRKTYFSFNLGSQYVV